MTCELVALALPGVRGGTEATLEGPVALETDCALTSTGTGATHNEAGNQGGRLLSAPALQGGEYQLAVATLRRKM